MGQPKPHGIDLDRLYKWRDKIHYETFEPNPYQLGWAAEHAQRDHLFVALQQFAPEATRHRDSRGLRRDLGPNRHRHLETRLALLHDEASSHVGVLAFDR